MADDFSLGWYTDEVEESSVDSARIAKFYMKTIESATYQIVYGQEALEDAIEEATKTRTVTLLHIGSKECTSLPEKIDYIFYSGGNLEKSLLIIASVVKSLKKEAHLLILLDNADTELSADKIDAIFKTHTTNSSSGGPFYKCEEYLNELKEIQSKDKTLVIHFGSHDEYDALNAHVKIDFTFAAHLAGARKRLGTKLIQKLTAIEEFDQNILYIIIDESVSKMISSKIAAPGKKDEDALFTRHDGVSSIEYDTEDSDWYKQFCASPYRGNFQIGLAMASASFPINFIMMLIAFIPIEKYYIRMSTRDSYPIELLKSAELVTLIAR